MDVKILKQVEATVDGRSETEINNNLLRGYPFYL